MPDKSLPSHARVVIIGGGVVGCSVAYHLAELGWTDIVLLERKTLTCGTTWHAAGLIAQLRATQNMTRLAKYSQELYSSLEEKTGVATGFRQNGSITVALTDARMEELRRGAAMARAFGVEIDEVNPADIASHYPGLNVSDAKGGVYLAKDGQADPVNITQALAKGARAKGVKIFEGVKVTAIHQKDGIVRGVSTIQEDIKADYVVNCGGMWAREIGQMAEVSVPLHACEHFYIVTEQIEGLQRNLPVLRVPDECAYYKEDAGKLLLGAFEPVAKPWGGEGIADDFEFTTLPDDFDHFMPILEKATARLPVLEKIGIQTFFNGPESFTPDDKYYLGEAPELKGFWVAAGYNSIGIVSSGGAGMALAQWIDQGSPPFDLWDVDIRRAQPFQKNRFYLRERVSETLGLLYADHWPYRQPETARGVRRSPLHEQLRAKGAVFGETAGWERANWFAREGQEREYRYDWGPQNWFDNAREEHSAVRNGVGLFDLSTFGKIRVEGADAMAFLQKVCANDVDVEAGRIVYTQMLNERGGIESDLTVTRLGETSFLLVVPAATIRRDMAWLQRHVPAGAHVSLFDNTVGEAVIAIMGPKSRELLQRVSPNDLGNNAHPFGFAQEIEVGMGLARAHRISYVGELGWELHPAMADLPALYDAVWRAGETHGIADFGLYALNSLRMEKAYRGWGSELTNEVNLMDADMARFFGKAKADFIGKAATETAPEGALRLVYFEVAAADSDVRGGEPIFLGDQCIGVTTSGGYGFAVKKSLGFGYVPPGQAAPGSRFDVGLLDARYPATVLAEPAYDPDNARLMS